MIHLPSHFPRPAMAGLRDSALLHNPLKDKWIIYLREERWKKRNMQNFVVPQFIDAEDKILAFITVRQFIIMLVDLLMVYLLNRLLTFGWFLLAALPLGGIGIVVAFVKINGQPFHFFLINLIATMKQPRARIWNKNMNDADLQILLTKEEAAPVVVSATKSFVTRSKLSEISLIVNTGGAYQGDDLIDQPK